ncbi:MAG: sensor histidine kinase [Leptolyngbya sp. DLM2.Bin15]|nr:MAG: sensor histidine kinase [Leptolyngbya sp. DLM2.Bin15]
MGILEFILGLVVGLLWLIYQRQRDRIKLKTLLSNLRSEEAPSSFSLESKLSIAITYQQQQIEQQVEQIEVFQRILQTAPIGYLHVDDENRLVWANSQAERLLNIPGQEGVPPRLLLELVRSYDLDELIDQTRQAERLQQADWVFYPVCSDLYARSQPQPRALRGYGMVLANRHVGVFLENRQEAVMLKQQRDRWISDVAHELKTPLTSIRLVAETLQDRLSPPLNGWAERLVNETIRLSNLVQDLLDLSQLEQRSLRQLKRSPTDLAQLLQTAWLNLEPLARKKKLRLSYNGPDNLYANVDEARMYRVFINLLDNSIKYSPVAATIAVEAQFITQADHADSTGQSTDQATSVDSQPSSPPSPSEVDSPESHIILDFIDAGEGFPSDAIEHVFDRFYRADPSRSRQSYLTLSSSNPDLSEGDRPLVSPMPHCSGSGLGLSIVQQIVTAHGGQITASNHPETHGAWLRLILPINPTH